MKNYTVLHLIKCLPTCTYMYLKTNFLSRKKKCWVVWTHNAETNKAIKILHFHILQHTSVTSLDSIKSIRFSWLPIIGKSSLLGKPVFHTERLVFLSKVLLAAFGVRFHRVLSRFPPCWAHWIKQRNHQDLYTLLTHWYQRSPLLIKQNGKKIIVKPHIYWLLQWFSMNNFLCCQSFSNFFWRTPLVHFMCYYLIYIYLIVLWSISRTEEY